VTSRTGREPVDWRSERKRVAGVYVKVSQGQDVHGPDRGPAIRNASYARIPVGGYHFATPGVGSPESQADRLIQLAPLRPGQLRPCVDCEWNELHLNGGQLAAWYLGFCIRVHDGSATGPLSTALLLTCRSSRPIIRKCFGRCPLWLAPNGVTHASPPAPWSHWAAWQ